MEAVAGEVYDPEFEATVRGMLVQLGEDPTREGLARTPLRVAKAMDFLTSGYNGSLEDIVNNAIFESDADEMVLVKDIEFYSLCEHHMLPFFGKAHVAYLPNKQDHRPQQDRPHRRPLSRAASRCRSVSPTRSPTPSRRCSSPHGVAVVMEAQPLLHDDARRAEAGLVDGHVRDAGRLPDECPLTRSEFLDLIRD